MPVFLVLCAFVVADRVPVSRVPTAAPSPQDTLVARGQMLFTGICSACHTLQPPAGKAPPMTHVARHYGQALPVAAERVQRIAAWISEPDSARSLLPAQARLRWGLMPPLLLPQGDRLAAAHYVSSLAAADGAAGGNAGMGMGMRRRGGGMPGGGPGAAPRRGHRRAGGSPPGAGTAP